MNLHKILETLRDGARMLELLRGVGAEDLKGANAPELLACEADPPDRLGSHLVSVTRDPNLENWGEWVERMPFINFPPAWRVAILPPSSGALVRFRVKWADPDKLGTVSVYFDGAGRLGASSDYWEAYPVPYQREGEADYMDTARHNRTDVEGLLGSIQESLDYQAREGRDELG